jgi:lysophospholipase L1-like esterase
MARKLRPHVVTWGEVDSPDPPPWAVRNFHRWNLLSEGDSWFTMAGIPTSNLLFEMRFPVSTRIVNCAMPGDTIKHLSQISHNPGLQRGLSKQDGEQWDLILLSGGGNDLIDEAGAILIDPDERGSLKMNNTADYCHQPLLEALINRITKGYQRIVELRDEPGAPSSGVPIVCHTYDYPTANNSPARFLGVTLMGPWLYRAFKKENIPEEDWIALADYMFEYLAQGILTLDGQLPNFHVVDTRNTIVRAKPGSRGQSGDWLNEIHPNSKGYAKLSRLIVQKALTLIHD